MIKQRCPEIESCDPKQKYLGNYINLTTKRTDHSETDRHSYTFKEFLLLWLPMEWLVSASENKGFSLINLFLFSSFTYSHWTIKIIRNNHFCQRYVVFHPRECYIKTILASFSNLCLVCEFYDVVIVGVICYFDSSTCEMNTHFHFLMDVLSTFGWVQSYAF